MESAPSIKICSQPGGKHSAPIQGSVLFLWNRTRLLSYEENRKDSDGL